MKKATIFFPNHYDVEWKKTEGNEITWLDNTERWSFKSDNLYHNWKRKNILTNALKRISTLKWKVTIF